jgi:hypothetical protein
MQHCCRSPLLSYEQLGLSKLRVHHLPLCAVNKYVDVRRSCLEAGQRKPAWYRQSSEESWREYCYYCYHFLADVYNEARIYICAILRRRCLAMRHQDTNNFKLAGPWKAGWRLLLLSSSSCRARARTVHLIDNHNTRTDADNTAGYCVADGRVSKRTTITCNHPSGIASLRPRHVITTYGQAIDRHCPADALTDSLSRLLSSPRRACEPVLLSRQPVQ